MIPVIVLHQLSHMRCVTRSSWMIYFIRLQPTFNTLHDSENDSQRKDKGSDPKSVPLHAPPAIVPPLRNGDRFSLVKRILENHEAIVPILEPTNLTSI
jgi:hypothetical protein